MSTDFSNIVSLGPAKIWEASGGPGGPGGPVGPVGPVITDDITPNAFSFIDQTGQALSQLITSNAVTISGINVAVTVVIVGGEYEINADNNWRSTTGSITNGSTIRVRHTSSEAEGTAVNTTLTIGNVADIFTTTTLVPVQVLDAVDPDEFYFSTQHDVDLEAQVISESVTISGINVPVEISIVNGEFEINGSGTWVSDEGTISLRDTLRVRHMSAGVSFACESTQVTVGRYVTTFESITLQEAQLPIDPPVEDTIPNPFGFIDQIDKNCYIRIISEEITITGIDAPSLLSIVGGEYEVNNSGDWSESVTSVLNNDTVKVRHMTADGYSTESLTVLSIGGVSGTFRSVTMEEPIPVDMTPDPFDFVDRPNVALNASLISDPITIVGINAPSPISITGGQYEINGSGTWVSGTGVVEVGDEVRVTHTTAPYFSTPTNTVLTVGGVSDTFTTTTETEPIPDDLTPDPFNFIDQPNTECGTLCLSNMITVVGINKPTSLSVTGGEYELNGSGTWANSQMVVSLEDTVRVRNTSASGYNTPMNTVLTIGGVSDTFTITTKVKPEDKILDAPEIVLAASYMEETTVDLIIDNYNPDVTYVITPSHGTLSRTGNIISWTFPKVLDPVEASLGIAASILVEASQDEYESSQYSGVTEILPEIITIPAPELQGVDSEFGGRTIDVTITNYSEDNTYSLHCVAGAVTREFDVISWELPVVAQDTEYELKVIASQPGPNVQASEGVLPVTVRRSVTVGTMSLLTLNFNFTYYKILPGVGFPRTSTTGNNLPSLGMETSAAIDYPSSWPQLAVLNEHNTISKSIACYPFSHPTVLYNEGFGMSPDDPCMVTSTKPNFLIYVEVEADTGYGIVKSTHTVADPDAPWNQAEPPELYIIGYVNSTGFPVLYTEDVGFAHRETPAFTNPHLITLEQTLSKTSKNRILLRSSDAINNTSLIEISLAGSPDANMTAMKLNAYKQSTPIAEILGSLLLKRSRHQSDGAEEGASVLMEASNGEIVTLRIAEDNGTYTLNINKE